jgi:hypothetical protein
MKKSVLRKIAAAALFTAATMLPTAAFADDLIYFNDGAGTCGYAACGPYGCTVIDTFPCPREVGGG